jgi:hypothetical protein
MKKGLFLACVATCCGFTTLALAQEALPSSNNAPPARTGFQMALRTGYMVPMGAARGLNPNPGPGPSPTEFAMSDGFSGQVPIFIEIGGKVIPNLFVGGYFGLGFGGAAGQIDTDCKQLGATCAAVSVRFGAELQYHILPAGAVNPWLGYGFGFESIALGISQGGQTWTDSFGGLEFGHFMGGLDFRVSRVFGIGPFVDFSVGQYTKVHVEGPGLPTTDADIQTKTTHEWLAFGARGTFFP